VTRVLAELRSRADPQWAAGMERFGITSRAILGISAPELRRMARAIGTDHSLAQKLWASGSYEARTIAYSIADPTRLTSREMERWAAEFDNWAICDGCCQDLFRYSPFAYDKIDRWGHEKGEYVRRAAFALIAKLAVHDRAADDARFVGMLPLIEEAATDPRGYVQKGVNWALREIGKRNTKLNRAAIATALRIQKKGPRGSRWIASDAIRELKSPAVRRRIRSRRQVR
jgi:3-methyladenine DNA glycosylase AlkD